MANPVLVNHEKSRKISELRKRDVITKHQENSWIPIAQYDGRTHTYVNIALNVKSLTSYSISYSCAYSLSLFGEALKYSDELSSYNYSYTTDRYYNLLETIKVLTKQNEEQFDAFKELYQLREEWRSFSNIKNADDFESASYIVNSDLVAKGIVSYTFAYTMDKLGWQIVNGQEYQG